MSAWAALSSDLKPTLDPRVFLEARDRFPMSEDERQGGFVATMRKIARGCDVAANVNAAKRTQWAANKAKREGLVKGRNDLDVKWPGGIALIEFKSGATGPEVDQIEYLNRMVAMGFSCAICRTSAGAMGWLRGLGAPIPVREGL